MSATILIRMSLGLSVAAGMQLTSLERVAEPKASQEVGQAQQSPDDSYGKLPACAPIKGKPAIRAKSPDVLGAKASTKTLTCFPKADADAGKKVLNGYDLACFACHGANAQWNPTVMLANMRAQGDGTLKLSNFVTVNDNHLGEMLGSVATAKQLKQVRAYLKTKFKG